MTESVAPTLGTLARGIDQNAELLETTNARLDTYISLSNLHLTGLDKQVDGLRDTIRSQHMLVSADIAAARRDIASVEEHVALLTAMVTAQAKVLESHGTMLEAHGTMLESHGKMLKSLTELVVQIRDAVLPDAP